MEVNARGSCECIFDIRLTTYSTLEPIPASSLAATSKPLLLAKPHVMFQTTYQDEHRSHTFRLPKTSVKGARIIGPNANASTKIDNDMLAVSKVVFMS